MALSDLLQQRRAIKQFDPDFKIDEFEFQNLIETAKQTPSSFNIQHWRFVVVKDKDARQKIRDAAWDQSQVTDASHLVVLCGDIKAWEKNPEQYWTGAPDPVQEMIVPKIKNFYEGRNWIQRDEALRSVGLIASTFMLTAIERGFDTCPMIGFDQDAVAEIINLPDDHLIGMLLPVGKRAQEPFSEPGRLAYEHFVIEDKF